MIVQMDSTSAYDFDTVTYKDRAEADGFNVVLGDDTHLTLDLDTADQQAHWSSISLKFTEDYSVSQITSWPSKSGKGRHVLIELETGLAYDRRIALQTILGSDRKREYLALMRGDAGAEYPVMLFQPQGAVITLEYTK